MIWWFCVAIFLAAVVGTWGVQSYAQRHAFLDLPNERSSHVRPTPRGGGLAFVAVIVIATLAAALAGSIPMRVAITVAVGGVLLGGIGWIDDLRGLRAGIRLVVQFAAAISALILLGGLSDITAFGRTLHLGMAGSVLAILGVVWFVNLFNFMDGIDGIAGSQGGIAAAFAAYALLRAGDGGLGMVCLAVSAALFGFVIWNWPPASIFMGDVGSGFIGFVLGVVAIAGEGHGNFGLLAMLAVTSPFFVDATITLLRRIANGEQPWSPHRSHLYQRAALKLGSHVPVTVAYLTLACIIGVGTDIWLMSHRDAALPCVLSLVSLSVLHCIVSPMLRQSAAPLVT